MNGFEEYDAESGRDVEKWSQPPELVELVLSQEEEKQLAEKAVMEAAIALAQMSVKVAKVMSELLEHPDPQVRLGASRLVMSRTIPQIAARHQADEKTVDSTDTAALRESIYDEITKKRGTNG